MSIRYKLGVVDVILHDWVEGTDLYTTSGGTKSPLTAANHDGPVMIDGEKYVYYEQDDDGELITGYHPHAGRVDTMSPEETFKESVTLLSRIERAN